MSLSGAFCFIPGWVLCTVACTCAHAVACTCAHKFEFRAELLYLAEVHFHKMLPVLEGGTPGFGGFFLGSLLLFCLIQFFLGDALNKASLSEGRSLDIARWTHLELRLRFVSNFYLWGSEGRFVLGCLRTMIVGTVQGTWWSRLRTFNSSVLPELPRRDPLWLRSVSKPYNLAHTCLLIRSNLI